MDFLPTLHLPTDNLQERREILEAELKKVIENLLFDGIKKDVNELLAEAGVQNAVEISWEFHPESDDEGGTSWYFEYISIETKDGFLDLDDYEIKKESWKKDGTFFDVCLRDELSDVMYDYRDDLFKYHFDSVSLV